MGYTLCIGEFKVESYPEDRACRATAEFVDGKDLGAPEDSTGFGTHANTVMPSYQGWGAAMKSLGLSAVFCGDGREESGRNTGVWTGPSGEKHDPILASHPGCVELTQDHLVAFERARDRWRDNREAALSYEFFVEHGGGSGYRSIGRASDEDYKWNLIRAEWLVWWTRWALENCKYPSFSNS